jgi:hypothetical protein
MYKFVDNLIEFIIVFGLSLTAAAMLASVIAGALYAAI